MSGEGAVVTHVLRRKIIRKFRDQCATDPRQAATLESLHLRKSNIVGSLIKNNVLVSSGEDRFYLDEEAAEQYYRKKRRAVFFTILITLMFILLFNALKK